MHELWEGMGLEFLKDQALKTLCSTNARNRTHNSAMSADEPFDQRQNFTERCRADRQSVASGHRS